MNCLHQYYRRFVVILLIIVCVQHHQYKTFCTVFGQQQQAPQLHHSTHVFHVHGPLIPIVQALFDGGFVQTLSNGSHSVDPKTKFIQIPAAFSKSLHDWIHTTSVPSVFFVAPHDKSNWKCGLTHDIRLLTHRIGFIWKSPQIRISLLNDKNNQVATTIIDTKAKNVIKPDHTGFLSGQQYGNSEIKWEIPYTINEGSYSIVFETYTAWDDSEMRNKYRSASFTITCGDTEKQEAYNRKKAKQEEEERNKPKVTTTIPDVRIGGKLVV